MQTLLNAGFGVFIAIGWWLIGVPNAGAMGNFCRPDAVRAVHRRHYRGVFPHPARGSRLIPAGPWWLATAVIACPLVVRLPDKCLVHLVT